MIFFSFLLSVHFLLFTFQKETLNPFVFQSEGFSGQNILIAKNGEPPEYENREHSVSLGQNFGQWIDKLKRNQEIMDSHNFRSILENEVCPATEDLNKKRLSFDTEKQRELLVEFVKIYGKVLSYSKNHNYFYCIYRYSGFPQIRDIVDISEELLTETEHKDFLEILNTCYEQEIEGNGDAYLKPQPYGEEEVIPEGLNHLVPFISQRLSAYGNPSFRPQGSMAQAREYDFTHAIFYSQKFEKPGIVDYFSNVIFENSSCKCPGSDRCTRGCLKNGVSPQFQCTKRKSRKKRCMRHVNAAIMSTVYAFFDEHCPNGPFDRDSCLKTKAQGTLCDQAFIFTSALCGLNLDGEDRYKMIKSREVRLKCRGWWRHNKKLIFVNILTKTGESLTIPLFQKIDMPEDPEDLPEGSIIVSKSENRHGHIEIKTSRRECGKEGSDLCFCSDFCQSHKGEYKWPFRPQVIFQWNPEFVYYFEKNEQSI